MKLFFGGCVLMFVIYLVRFSFAWIIMRNQTAKLSQNLEIDKLQVLFDCLFLGGIFSGAQYIIDNGFAPFIEHLFYVSLIALIPSYIFLVKPLLYLAFERNFISADSGVKLESGKYNVRIMRTRDVNAYAIGVLPWSKTILLSEILSTQLTKEELFSMQLHEEGHLVKNHLNKLFLVNLLVCSVFYVLLTIRFSVFEFANNVVGIFSIGLLGCLYGLLVWYLPGKVQYYFELEADTYAARKNGKENLISALRKLDVLSNGEVSHGGITHPSLDIRINEINKCA